MHRRTAAAVAAVAALGATAIAVAPADAKPLKKEIRISGGAFWTVNKGTGETFRFNNTTSVKSGGTVTVRNKSKIPEAPHTISLVKKSSLPSNAEEASACDNLEGVCGPLVVAHQFNIDTGEPGLLLYNAGADGFDVMGDETTAGDSLFIPPMTKTISFKVSAPKGSTLTYFCAIHTWMQGKIKVT